MATPEGGDGDRALRSAVTLRIKPWSSSWNVQVVAGLAYFLADELNVEVVRLAVFDLATEEWKPATLQGALTSRRLDSTNNEEEDNEPIMHIPRHDRPLLLLRMKHFQLARLGESSVVLYCNVKKGLTELWFVEDMVDDTTAC